MGILGEGRDERACALREALSKLLLRVDSASVECRSRYWKILRRYDKHLGPVVRTGTRETRQAIARAARAEAKRYRRDDPGRALALAAYSLYAKCHAISGRTAADVRTMTTDIVVSAWELRGAALAATGRDGPAGAESDRAKTARDSDASTVQEAAEETIGRPLSEAARNETRDNWEAAWAEAEREVEGTLPIEPVGRDR